MRGRARSPTVPGSLNSARPKEELVENTLSLSRSDAHSTNAASSLVEHELQHDRQFHPNLGGVTKGGLANHYPMTLLALHGLGATDDEVRAFRQAWPRHRATIAGDLHLVDRGLVTAENWPRFLGQSERLPEFRRVFEALIERQGLAAVTAALVAMRDALPMGLFHPLIRLSFGVTHGDRGLIADALAYMAIRHSDLFHTSPSPRAIANDASRSAASVWRRLADEDDVWRLTHSFDGRSIHFCERLCAESALHEAALPADFGVSRATLPVRIPEICALALRLYLFAPSLTTLHGVTAAQALADLTGCLSTGAAGDDGEAFAALWARYWIWLSALYIEKGRPRELPVLDPRRVRTEPNWPELARLARAIPEVHLIKMAYSCRWLDETFGPEPLYKLAVVNMLSERNAHPRQGSGLVQTAL